MKFTMLSFVLGLFYYSLLSTCISAQNPSLSTPKGCDSLIQENEKILKQKQAVERSSFESRKRELAALKRVKTVEEQHLLAEQAKEEADSLKNLAVLQHKETQKNHLKAQVNLLLQEGDFTKAFRLAEHIHQVAPSLEKKLFLCHTYYHSPFQVENAHFAAPFQSNLHDFKQPLKDAQFSPDNTQILFTFENQSYVSILQQRSHREILLKGHTAPIVSAQYSPDGEYVFTASIDSSLKIWNRQGQFLSNFKDSLHNIQDLQISDNGAHILTASFGEVKIWDTKGNPLVTISFPSLQIKKVAWSPQQDYILIHYKNTLEIWQQRGKKLKYKPIFSKTYSAHFHSLQFSANSRYVLAGADDGTAQIWEINAKELKEKALLKKHKKAVNSAYFSPDNLFVVTASDDRTSCVWEWNTTLGKALEIKQLSLQSTDTPLQSARFSADNRQILTTSQNGSSQLWHWRSKPIHFFEGQFNGSTLSPTEHLFANIEGNQIIVRNFQNEVKAKWKHNQKIINNLHFSGDGELLLSTSRDSTLKVWNWQGQQLVDSLKMKNAQLFAEFSPTNKNLIALSTEEGHLHLLNWQDQAFNKVIKAHQAPINTVHFSADGRYIVSAADDKMAIIWDAKTAKKVLILQGHNSAVSHARFSQEGDYLVSTSQDAIAKIWQTNDNHVTQLAYKGHTKELKNACFVGGNEYVLTTSKDGRAKLWNKEGKLLQNIEKAHPITSVLFSYDLQYLLIFTKKGVYIESIEEEHLIETANKLSVPALSKEDKKWYGVME